MTQTSSDDLQSINNKIQQLYDFRDRYFLEVPEEQYALKDLEISRQTTVTFFLLLLLCDDNLIVCYFQSILDDLNQLFDKVKDMSTFYFLKGWLLNIKSDYDKDVFDSLTKSIKLNPEYKEAWIELGECYFKKGDLKLALNCFEKVIKQDAFEKKALRNASIMLRSLQCTPDEKMHNITKSIEFAKRAVECDLNDGNSWAILGNAYLMLLFASNKGSQSSFVRNCKSAYQKALLDDKVKVKTDVLFNYASILQHEEEFEQTLHTLANACKYDIQWKEPQERKQNLMSFLSEICQKFASNTLIKSKRLTKIKENLIIEENRIMKLYSSNNEMCQGHVQHVEDLNEGSNDCLMICKVVSYTTDSHNVFLCSVFYVIDSNGHNISLFIYDLVMSKGPKIGDLLLIVHPFVKSHKIVFEDKEFSFKAIKIVNPLQDIYVNNKRLSLDCISIPAVNVTLKSD